MKPENRSAHYLSPRSARVLTAALALIVVVCAPGSAAGAAQRSVAALRGCPDLRSGQEDPIDGRDCVRALQLALREHGYPRQGVTGRFLGQTEANVLDFQRGRGIRPASGLVGPQTRAALTDRQKDRASSEPTPPSLNGDDHSGVTGLSWTGYDIYLRRSTTRELAQWLRAHPWLSAASSSTVINGACRVLKLARPVTLLCEIVGGFAADGTARRLQEAADQGACLRVSLGLNFDGAVPVFVRARPDHSRHCAD